MSPTTRVERYSNRLPRSVKLEQQPAFVNGAAPVNAVATDFIVGRFRRNCEWMLYLNSSYNPI